MVILSFGDWMNEIFYNVSLNHGISYGEFVREIKKAQAYCGEDNLSVDEFVKKLTLMALERYAKDNL